jgi:histidine triad (HIT) family protein
MERTMSDCLFCKIIENKIPAQKVYEDDFSLIFKDINPQAPIHYLAIPKKHYSGVHQIPTSERELLPHLFDAVNNVIESQELASKGGYRLVINFGENSGQAVHHIHVHILSGRKMDWPPG